MPLTTRARSALLALALPAALFAGAAHAETLSCPALDKAVQVAACPSDATGSSRPFAPPAMRAKVFVSLAPVKSSK